MSISSCTELRAGASDPSDSNPQEQVEGVIPQLVPDHSMWVACIHTHTEDPVVSRKRLGNADMCKLMSFQQDFLEPLV